MKNAKFCFLAFLLVGFMSTCTKTSDPKMKKMAADSENMSRSELLKRGEHLVLISLCDDCHSPKIMTAQGPIIDFNRRLSGHPRTSILPSINKSDIEPGKWVLFNDHFTAAVGPWGVSFTANLTPHETGLGNWTFDHFKKALKEGKHKGLDNERMILPPMPWEGFRHHSDQDLRAIFEYLKTLKPIDNLVPEPIPASKI